MVKNPPANAGDMSLIPGSGRSHLEANGNPLQYPCLGNPMDRGAWQATVRGIPKSQTRLNNQTTKAIGAMSGNVGIQKAIHRCKVDPEKELSRQNTLAESTSLHGPSSSL